MKCFLPDKNKQEIEYVSRLKRNHMLLFKHGIPVRFPFKHIIQFYIYFVN